jgi:hypothetical protein
MIITFTGRGDANLKIVTARTCQRAFAFIIKAAIAAIAAKAHFVR